MRHKTLRVGIAGLMATAALALGDSTVGSATSRCGHHGHGDHRQRGTVWVVNRDQEEVTVFDAATGDVLRTEPAGPGAHDVVVSSRAGKAYVTNDLDNTVSVFSASTADPIGLITFDPRPPETVTKPHHAKLSRDGSTVYVGLVGTNRIGLIDTATDTPSELDSSASAAARAHAPRPSRKGRFIYVPHETGNEVTAVDAESGDFLLSVKPGLQPSEVLPTRRGRHLFVSLRGEGRVKVIDLRTGLVSGEVFIGDLTQPESLILTRDETHAHRQHARTTGPARLCRRRRHH